MNKVGLLNRNLENWGILGTSCEIAVVNIQLWRRHSSMVCTHKGVSLRRTHF